MRLRRVFRRIPTRFRIPAAAAALLVVFLAINWVYQVARKPAELLFPVSGVLNKTPGETWAEYRPLFRKHSTAVMTPELLAALAQVEGAGNPAARTYWRLRLSSQPFDVYKPASSAVGMYQITDGTFREAKRYCIQDHAVVEDGPWHAWRSCWFNWTYTRIVPGHAIEMTSAFLDRQVGAITKSGASLPQKQDLAAVIHLCGAGAGKAYAQRGFRPVATQACGEHDLRGYLAQVNSMKRVFSRLAAQEAGN